MTSASNKTQHKLCMKQKHVIQTAVDARYTCNTRHACIIHFTVFKHVFRGPISRQACIMHFTVYGHVFRGPDLDHYDHTYRTPVPTPPAAVPVAPAPIAPRTARRVLPTPPSEEGEEKHPRYSCTVGFSVLL